MLSGGVLPNAIRRVSVGAGFSRRGRMKFGFPKGGPLAAAPAEAAPTNTPDGRGLDFWTDEQRSMQ